MVKAIYTTFDGEKFDDIENAKSHEQYEVEKSPVRVLGEVLRQLKKGEALSTNEADYISLDLNMVVSLLPKRLQALVCFVQFILKLMKCFLLTNTKHQTIR